MCSKTNARRWRPRTATARLTLWTVGLFGLLSLGGFAVGYASLASGLRGQINAELRSKGREFLSLYRQQGPAALGPEFAREAATQGAERVFFEHRAPGGEVLATSATEPWEGLIDPAPGAAVPHSATLPRPGPRRRVRVLTQALPDGSRLRIAVSLADNARLLERYRETFGTAWLLMMAGGGLGGWLLARKAMAGVKRVTATAERIGPLEFGRRVATTGQGEEIDALVRAFNGMLSRIETLLRELRGVTDNVAHELRTPLTRIRGLAETGLRTGAQAETQHETLATVVAECDGLIALIGTMLEIARTDAGVETPAREPVDLAALVDEAVDLFVPAAEDHDLTLRAALPGSPVIVAADRRRLQRVAANLLDNAVKYTAAGGTVTVDLAGGAGGVTLRVRDTGPPIGPEDLPRLFERFFRGDRSRATAGSGLGLSLARAIVRAHGGDLTAASDAAGNTFTVRLPNLTER